MGSPGGTTSAVIGVGAMATKTAMESTYSLLEPVEEQPFTWSSRGPTLDGDIGVDLVCPGSANTTIPNYLLGKSALMNGTSMSSPNCVGCITLLLSALLQQQQTWSPFYIQRALKNTCKTDELSGFDRLSIGSGLVKILDAYEWTIKFPYDEADPASYKIQINGASGGSQRGIYIRELAQTQRVMEYNGITIDPIFSKVRNDSGDKIAFEKRLIFLNQNENSTSWIQCPKYHMITADTSHNRGFSIRVDPTHKSLIENSYYSEEIVVLDASYPEAGPLFRIPITVIKPMQLLQSNNNGSGYLLKKNISFKGQRDQRFFIQPPQGATSCEVTLKNVDETDNAKVISLQMVQILPKTNVRNTSKEKWMRLAKDQEDSMRMPCYVGTTLEICISQGWHAVRTEGIVECQIEFRGVNNICGDEQISFAAHERVRKILLRSSLKNEDVTPKITLQQFGQEIGPSSYEFFSPKDERNILPDGHPTHELVLTYQFKLVADAELRVYSAVLNELLYESKYEAQLTMIYNQQTKQTKSVSDCWPKKTKLPKGEYLAKILIRHEKLEALRRLKNMIVTLEQNVKEVSLDCFGNVNDALTEKRKLNSLKIPKGMVESIEVKALRRKNIPVKSYKTGDFLLGTMKYFSSNSHETMIKYFLPTPKNKDAELSFKSKSKAASNSFPDATSGKQVESSIVTVENNENTNDSNNSPRAVNDVSNNGAISDPGDLNKMLQAQLLDKKISFLSKQKKSEETKKLILENMDETSLPYLQMYLKYLDDENRKGNRDEILSTCEKMIPLCQVDKLQLYLLSKKEDLEMEKKRKAYYDILVKKCQIEVLVDGKYEKFKEMLEEISIWGDKPVSLEVNYLLWKKDYEEVAKFWKNFDKDSLQLFHNESSQLGLEHFVKYARNLRFQLFPDEFQNIN